MKKFSIRAILLAFCFVIAATFMPFGNVTDDVFADSGTVSMTAYSQVLKSGKTFYCAGAKGIYKVSVKKGKVKSKKCIFKYGEVFSVDSYVSNMVLIGKTIYFNTYTNGTVANICKVGTNGKGMKHLATQEDFAGFVISGNNIYYQTIDWDDYYDEPLEYTGVITLGGAYVGKSNLTPVVNDVQSNVKGYKMIAKKSGKYVKDYLKTPKGKFYLGKTKLYD